MLLGRRRSDPAQAIQTFWRWWSTAAPRLAAAGGSAGHAGLVDEVTARVRAIQPGLQWEWGRGASSRYAFVVCAGGDPALRATAQRWLAAAPAADETWQFHASRQSNPGLAAGTMTVAGRELSLAGLRYAVRPDPARYQVSVTAYHPAFANLSAQQRNQVTFLALDWTLGETRADVWLGSVGTATVAPACLTGVAELVEAVEQVQAQHAGNTWTMSSTGRLVSLSQVPLKPARWPRFDTHVGVSVAYAHRDLSGLPAQPSVVALRGLQDRLVAAAGRDGELVAHSTGDGRRVLHFYVDGHSGAADGLRAALAGWAEGHTGTRTALDPAFTRVADLWPVPAQL